MTILWGRYAGMTGIVDSAVLQRTVDHPEEYAPGYHVILDTGRWLRCGDLKEETWAGSADSELLRSVGRWLPNERWGN